MSARRRADSVVRRALCARVLEERPDCEAGPLVSCADRLHVCGGRSVDLHEPLTRARGGDPLDERQVLAVCRPCHDWIHRHVSYATELGLLLHSWEAP